MRDNVNCFELAFVWVKIFNYLSFQVFFDFLQHENQN